VREFKQVFGKCKIDFDQVTVAIAEFEKTLVTPNSRFDPSRRTKTARSWPSRRP
jgi:cytochrome c peroxidase